mgnify:CR=1 FL=1
MLYMFNFYKHTILLLLLLYTSTITIILALIPWMIREFVLCSIRINLIRGLVVNILKYGICFLLLSL